MKTEHLFIFDGDCGICSRFVGLLLRADEDRFRFLPLGSAAAVRILRAHGVAGTGTRTSYVQTSDGRLLAKSAAILFALQAVGWRPRLVALARLFPGFIADRVYDVVARLRRHLLAPPTRCPVPTASQAARLRG